MQELDDYINKVKHLPAAPRILPELLGLLKNPNVDSSKIVNLITYDPGLTANILQVCNSAAFSRATTQMLDLNEAIGRLGFEHIYRLVAAIMGARALTPAQKGYGLDQGELWKHSVTTAVAAQCIAEELGENTSTVFTAALLHDIGKIVLAEALVENYAKLVSETERNQQSLLEAEKSILGVQHAEIGGRLLARWKFPANLVSAVWFHHNPKAAGPYEKLAAYVYLGNMIAYFIGHGFGHQAFALRGRADALSILQLTPDSLPRFMISTFERMETVESFIAVAA